MRLRHGVVGASVVLFLLGLAGSARAADAAAGATISYQLAVVGQGPTTWRVTLAIVDVNNPDWIVSQFASGVVRTATTENQGKFTEVWNGLDDNFMPVPPGKFGVKGIYMPAERWPVDEEYHSIVPRFVSGASAWMPSPQQWDKPEPFGGDPVGQPLAAVAVGPNGIGVFYYVYLENGLNCPMIDLNKPLGYEQFVRAFHSGGAAGGDAVATDGQSVWAYSTDGGPKFVYRADEKPFGSGTGANRNNVYRPDGWVTAMSAWRSPELVEGRDPAAGKSFVYVAQRGKFTEVRKREYVESTVDFADKVTVHAGEDGKVLAELPLSRPRGLAVYNAALYALHADGNGSAVSFVPLEAGLPRGSWKRLFVVPANIEAFDLAIDSHGRLYLSDPAANKVYQLDRAGKVLLTYGRLDVQRSETYDPLTLMSPGKLATWTDHDGNDRLIIVEQAGPNRAAEWSADGKLLRDFLSLQTKANDGYAVDPEDPRLIYIAGHRGWLTRFKLDLDTRKWTVDAVWPDVGTDPLSPGFDHPQFIRANRREYIACGRSNNVYRHDGTRWLLSAAIVRQRNDNKTDYFSWHDARGDGRVRLEDCQALDMPGMLIRYHGNQWLDDLSLAAINQGGPDVWRLAPAGFDARGNPIFKQWQKLLTDSVFEARAAHAADAIHGGNELADTFSSDWAMVDGAIGEGFYVNARGGPNFSANEGSQVKISRYVPDSGGGYRMKWRTGREAMQRLAEPGEIYGAIHVRRPINGLLSVVDQSRCGILLYTDEGLYVDTVFLDGRRFSPANAGVYPLPGEFFAGAVVPDKDNGKIYFAMGKYAPMVFEAQGWSLTQNPVRPLESVQKTVEISAAQIAAPPEIALSVRGGAGAARVVRFAPALGGAALDGSLAGWESCEPVNFAADKEQTVEVRCLYDPDHLYLRWHARLGDKFSPKARQPIDRIFTHDRLADTLSFYFQGDVNAKPNGPTEGRAGDVRIVFGIFDDAGKAAPVALGMYPKWQGAAKPAPLTYATPTGKASFEHVGILNDVKLGSRIDDDGKGFVIAAIIPRSAIPSIGIFGGDVRTLANFSATFAGHNRFWWANRDGSASRETYDEPTEARLYPGSWAPAQFQPLADGVTIRNWLICGPFGGPGAEQFIPDPRDKMKDAVHAFCEAAKYPPDDGKVDLAAVYKGDSIHGYWNGPAEVRWRPATVADLDTRVVLGPSAQTWYGATWVYAPAETELEFRFQLHPQTFLRFFLNGQLVQSGEVQAARDQKFPTIAKPLKLRTGWNQLLFRGYCIGYPPFRAGIVLAGPPEKLFQLKLSANPPG
jgi:hypothetical protein